MGKSKKKGSNQFLELQRLNYQIRKELQQSQKELQQSQNEIQRLKFLKLNEMVTVPAILQESKTLEEFKSSLISRHIAF